MSYQSTPAIERILKKVIKKDNGCWIYTGQTNDYNYGMIKVGGKYGKPKKVSRVVYQHYIGDIPEGLFVCHKCDNTLCCNPEHLFLGTHQDNMDDMVLKGRSSRIFGENSQNAKLTGAQVLEIRNSNSSYREICKKYNIAKSTVSAIKNFKSRVKG